MRILFLSNLYPPNELGGYEQWCQEVALLLRQRGHQVQVLTSHYGDLNKSAVDEEYVIRSLYMQADVNYYRPLDFFLKTPYQEKANLNELRRIIQQFSPDLVMVWGMWNLSLSLPYWAEKWMPGRVAYYVSSYWPMDVDPHTAYWQLQANRSWSELFKKPLRYLALRRLRKDNYPPELQFRHVVCCSQFVRDTLVKAGSLPATATVLFGGIDPQPFLQLAPASETVQKKPLRLLYFGRLISDKGVHTAVKAVGLLKQCGYGDRVILTILGDGHPDYVAMLNRMCDQEGITDKVRLVGRVAKEDVPHWLGSSDVYLFTSIWPEPMARSVMEAMAAGLVVIGSQVGGQLEMLQDGQNALTFPPEDEVVLANQIACVLENPMLQRSLATAGRQAVLQHFTLTRMVDEIEVFLQQAMNVDLQK
jgi:glycogen synthase